MDENEEKLRMHLARLAASARRLRDEAADLIALEPAPPMPPRANPGMH